MFSHKPSKKHDQPQKKEKHDQEKPVLDRWTELPPRDKVWLNGCGGWVNYKWNKNTWKPW